MKLIFFPIETSSLFTRVTFVTDLILVNKGKRIRERSPHVAGIKTFESTVIPYQCPLHVKRSLLVAPFYIKSMRRMHT
jgi:hypothetical protein